MIEKTTKNIMPQFRSQRAIKTLRAGLFLPLLLVVASCDRNVSPFPLVGTVERDRIELVAEASEEIIDVLVTEGQRVEKGQLLIKLNDTRQKAIVRRAEAIREAAAQRLAELIRGPREEAIREARARLAGAQETQQVRQKEFERVSELVARNLAADFDGDVARNNLDRATAEVLALRAGLDALVVGTTAEEIGQAQAQLDAAEADVDVAAFNLSRLSIAATRSGTVDAIPWKVGMQPPMGGRVIVLLGDSAPYVRVFVPESIRAQVVPGTIARVSVDGIESDLSGSVRYIASDAAFTPYFSQTERDRSRLSYIAEITLDEARAAAIPSGVIADVWFASISGSE